MKKFEGLLKSEIKKAETAANKFFGRKDCKVTGYFHSGADEYGNATVICEICFNYEERADYDVSVSVIGMDRRRSFARIKTW